MFTPQMVKDELAEVIANSALRMDAPFQDVTANPRVTGDSIAVKLSDGSVAYITVDRVQEPCEYTHAHTRKFCGHPFCREA
jgi:hypothetical protein